MNVVFEAALRIQGFLQARGWKFCIIGGLAVQKWGEPRVTDDVDITLLTGFGEERAFINELLAQPWLVPRTKNAAEFAEVQRVLLLTTDTNVGIDIAMGAFPFEAGAIERARPIEIAKGRFLHLCSAEDLVVMKTFAGRDQDWGDIRSISHASP